MIWLIPIQGRKNRIDPILKETLCKALEETFQKICKIQTPMKPPSFALPEDSSQYIGARLLESLPVEEDAVVLGITRLDLSMIGYDYTTGLSDPSSGRAIIGISRMRWLPDGDPEDTGRYAERIIKRAIHEVGHAMGLPHCEDQSCVMSYSDTLDDVDRKSHSFCEQCESTLKVGAIL